MADVVLRGRSAPMASALGVVRKVVRTGQGDGLVITGEAGIGKSAPLTAVLREAGRLGAACGTVRADRIGRIVPGGPLLDSDIVAIAHEQRVDRACPGSAAPPGSAGSAL